MVKAVEDRNEIRGMKRRGRPPKATMQPPSQPVVERHDPSASDRAQALALRIWEGQCPDLPVIERMARVRAGVEAQGLSMEGVTIE